MAIDLLRTDQHVAFLERVSGGLDAYTYRGLIRFHDGPNAVPCHCKIYSERSPRGLVNEVVGHLTGVAVGLRVANRAGVTVLPAAAVDAFPGFATAGEGVEHYAVWCAETFDGQSPKQMFYPNATDLIRPDLQRWEELPSVVAFDAWIANIDRNLGNLIRIRKGRYALIDHGQVCTGPAWTQSSLDPKRFDYPNKLASIAWGSPIPSAVAPNVCEAFEQFANAYEKAHPGLEVWLQRILGDSPQDAEAILAFLQDRADRGGAGMKSQLGILL